MFSMVHCFPNIFKVFSAMLKRKMQIIDNIHWQVGSQLNYLGQMVPLIQNIPYVCVVC